MKISALQIVLWVIFGNFFAFSQNTLQEGVLESISTKVLKIEAYYVPWKTIFDGFMPFAELKEHSFTQKRVFVDADTVNYFYNTLSIFNMEEVEHSSIDARIVMNFYFTDGCMETIALSKRCRIYWRDKVYKNSKLLFALLLFIPEMGKL